jgi:hypothetical protein
MELEATLFPQTTRKRLYPYTGALSRAIELMTKENMPRELCATDTGLRWRAIGVTPISNGAPSCRLRVPNA